MLSVMVANPSISVPLVNIDTQFSGSEVQSRCSDSISNEVVD